MVVIPVAFGESGTVTSTASEGTVIDHYAESAEFIDLLISPFWKEFGPVLAGAVETTGPGSGVVVDIGAGSGCGTVVIGNALPGAEIHAVEPSAGLRSVLLARINSDESLRGRVTVLPEDFLRARLPDRWDLVVAMNVIGHFSAAERKEVWRLLSQRLAPQGRAVLNLQPPAEPVAVPESLAATAHLGRRRYEGWARAEPAGHDALTWHMTYRTHHDDDLVDERTVAFHWNLVTESRMRDELADAGLELRTLPPAEFGAYVITRKSRG
ncbi:class I SAM-dependent methyltransferase [Saccharopolyspora taberi]|uniref:Methyltransferase type 12 domain-containing protein n=1 Tax=Saccharopolyspora taberi TaxID=60895 RepID=A0ABN3VCV0_9PSEU